MEQLAAKEESASKLMQERRKELLAMQLIREEKSKLDDLLAKAKEVNEGATAYRTALEQEAKSLKEMASKRDEERAKHQQFIEHWRAQAEEAKLREEQAKAQLKVLQDSEMRSAEREKSAMSAAHAEGATVKRLTQERDALQRQLNHKRSAEPSGGGGGGGGASGELKEQLEYYRGIVKCPLCMKNEKNAVINKCFHTFCRDCIDQRLNLRNRKCPTCAVPIDFQSVKELFLTH